LHRRCSWTGLQQWVTERVGAEIATTNGSTYLTGLPGLPLLHEVHGTLVRGEQDPLPVEVHISRCLVVPPCLPGCRLHNRARLAGAVCASYLRAALLLLCCACLRQPRRRFHVRFAAERPDRRQLQVAICLRAMSDNLIRVT